MGMSVIKPACSRKDCFRNNDGQHCELLTEWPSNPCPFYKTTEQNDSDIMTAHKRLLELGKFNLIRKYEYNKQRKGQW